MDDLLKKVFIVIIIVSKPPVFLTVSILLVIGYLTFVVLNTIIHEITSFVVSKQNGDPTLILLIFVSAFGVCWCVFFYSLAKYSSRRGLHCIPVTLVHLIVAGTFEYLVYATVNSSVPKDKLIDSNLKHSLDHEKFNVIFTYTVWICSIFYSFFYFLSEELMILFSREDSLVEFIHLWFLNLTARTMGIDLSDLPNGESIFNPALERMMNPNQQNFVPPSQAEYNSVRRRRFLVNNLLEKNAERPKDRKHLSWNTLR